MKAKFRVKLGIFKPNLHETYLAVTYLWSHKQKRTFKETLLKTNSPSTRSVL